MCALAAGQRSPSERRIGTLFDAWDAGSTVPAITVIPEFLWELSLGIYCTVWGFKKSSPILTSEPRAAGAL